MQDNPKEKVTGKLNDSDSSKQQIMIRGKQYKVVGTNSEGDLLIQTPPTIIQNSLGESITIPQKTWTIGRNMINQLIFDDRVLGRKVQTGQLSD